MPDPLFTPLVLDAPDGARASLLPYGAHVVDWSPAAGPSTAGPSTAGTSVPGGASGGGHLFVSARAEYRVGAAVRGGVPVIFPQFGDLVPGPDAPIRHGFARTASWQVERVGPTPDGAAEAVLTLQDDASTRARWPHAFRAALTVRVAGRTLALTLAVENPGDAAFAFTGALHSYLRVGDAARAQVHGLETVTGRDQAAAGATLAPLGHALGFGTEVDHLYRAVPGPVLLDDPALARRTRITQTGWRDVVVWNPGPERAAALADLEPDGWQHFVCVEAVAADPVTLAPGARWSGTQQLTALDAHEESRA